MQCVGCWACMQNTGQAFFEYVLAKPLMIIYPDRVFAKLHL